MAVLTTIVAALALAVAANFLLTLAVVRRLRLQQPAPQPIAFPEVGMQVPSFSVRGLDGRLIDERFYKEHDEAIVAFFSDNCEPCERAKIELTRDQINEPILAFVRSEDGGSQQDELAAALARAGAQTVALDSRSDVPLRFAVRAFPTFLRVREGIVVASGARLTDVRGTLVAANETARRGRRIAQRMSAVGRGPGELIRR